MAAGQGGHTRLQGHVEVGRTAPGGQIQDQQGESPALQQFDGRGGGQLRLFRKNHHQVSQIDAGFGQIRWKGGSFGIAYPGHPLSGALAFQQQLQSQAEVASALTG